LLDDLYSQAKEQAKVSSYCLIGQWAISLSDSDKAAFDISIDDVDFSTRSLFKLYKKAGATFGLTSLLTHRNGECGCP
jgi:hypothetical protein